MKIKRYTARSMREALAQVRAEQGADAVILSSRRGEDGIEVIAAVDYDEGLFASANRQRSTAVSPVAATPAMSIPARTASPEAAVAAPRKGPQLIPAHFQRLTMSSLPVAAMLQISESASDAPVAKPAQPDRNYTAMQRELQDMRQMLESGLAGITWNDKRLREPLKARVLEDLSAMDIAPDVAATLAKLTPQRTSLENPSHIPMALLVKHLPVVEDLASVSGGVMVIVGPTGAGKTTTIAKLAARWCMRHRAADLALVSTDGYRSGARDQLLSYARALGAEMHTANGGKDLARVLQQLKSKKLILVDTAGMGPRDARLPSQLAALEQGAPGARILLALPAQAESQALEEIVRAFAPLNPVACILTKVDEAASLGAVISTTLRHRLKIAYVCDGQRVPEDMHAAHQKRVSLIRSALALKEGKRHERDAAYYVRNFGGGSAHA